MRSTREAQPAAVLVNCTPVGLRAGDDPFATLPLEAADLGRWEVVVDLAYGAHETGLVAAARQAGTRVLDGLDVLVPHAAMSFERWTGRPAPLEAMRTAARS